MQFDKDMNSKLAELFLNIREFIIKEINTFGYKAKERYSDNITSIFSDEFDSGFCYIKTKDDYVRLGWFKGIYINDKFGFLIGKGKSLRGQNIKKFDSTCKEAIKYYIEETHTLLVEHEEKKKLKSMLK